MAADRQHPGRAGQRRGAARTAVVLALIAVAIYVWGFVSRM